MEDNNQKLLLGVLGAALLAGLVIYLVSMWFGVA